MGDDMSEYRIEWQMGGEVRISISDEATEDEVRKEVERTLAGISEDVADDIGSELDAGVISYDGTAEATVFKLAVARPLTP